MKEFKNLLEVTTYFSDQNKATEYLALQRWNGKTTCAHCNHEKVYELKGDTHKYKCAACRKLFSVTKGTIFENSAIPLQKWFVAIYLITSHKKGISSHQLAKDLSITQKSAWFVLHRVRFALQSGTFVHSKNAILEIDETYIGGDAKNKHADKKTKNARGGTVHEKKPVLGILERGGNVIVTAMPTHQKKHIMPIIDKNVTAPATIMTDDYNAYNDLENKFTHESVNHSAKEYVRGRAHTNGIENFWSHLQRGIDGIYHQISMKHLDKYLDEYEFRFNTRKMSEIDRFEMMLGKMCNRLTYAELIKDEEKTKGFYQFRPEAG